MEPGQGNGPRTHELVAEIELVREQIREERHEVNSRVTALETKMKGVMYFGGMLGTFVVSVSVLVFVGVLNP